ncbi:hypothetical protein [Hyalangium gracile]|uniref:hypothetical protein n=1 Tax=Hyalangium gracile TaxID=394092 RepID=UPI001CCE51B9|nr:hypothetical protein [Hyalangium gracile]
MSRAGIIAVALLFTGATAARAQESVTGSMLGLPLVIKEGGWARYVGESSEGPLEFVFKVGGTGRHAGKSGRWIILEVEVPMTGRITLQFLVNGDRFSAKNVLLLRMMLPGQPPRDSSQAFAKAGEPNIQPRVLKEAVETIAGRKINVTEYAYPGGISAGWSPSVPALGLTHVSGAQSYQLVAFGVGGDPWKGTAPSAIWPEPPAKK